ncbi:hypothetical protein O3M35_006322 [Rhynocoris fuscipes]|uniref:40S ribosomal protein S27 n=1 Tax=Rhynocoris fuscipes TaxID=488301 RepID=A0AAW1DI83_9HEMI
MSAKDLLYPSTEEQSRVHKKKSLIPHTKSYFNRVKCENCQNIQIIYSHATTTIKCFKCGIVLTRKTGGKCELINCLVHKDKLR